MTRFDLPSPDLETQPFWDAAKEGRLLIRHCTACDEYHFYPRPFCPSCWSEAVEWFDASGRATLYTWSVVYQNDLPPWPARVPYVAAVVDLAEGPRMQTNVVECEFDALADGMELEVVFQATSEDVTIPVFRPAAAASADGSPGTQ
ncbi:MAG: Zn-ribbon domain-containing OB-fold protein [Acidimicrobiia bacterium]